MAALDPTGHGVILRYSFTYRGSAEEWSNAWHFQGDIPSDNAGWRALVDSLAALVGPALATTVTIVGALCYEDMTDDAVYSYDMAAFDATVTGERTGSDGNLMPGDDAIWIRFSTDRVSDQGKPIYLRKYFHGVFDSSSSAPDAFSTAQRTAFQTLAAAVLDPSDDWPGLADLQGAALPGGYLTSSYITTRSLKRRGRRPS